MLPVLLSTPVAPTESNLLQLPLVGPSMNVTCETIGMELSTRCTDGRSTLHTPSTLFRHVGSFLVLRVLAVRAVPTGEILPLLAVTAVQNPKYLK